MRRESRLEVMEEEGRREAAVDSGPNRDVHAEREHPIDPKLLGR